MILFLFPPAADPAASGAAPGRISVLDWSVLLLYLLTLVGMGFYFSRRERTTEDFFLGGRAIPWWAAGVSIFGTQLSAITFLAVPAKAFAADWVYFLVNMTIILVAPLVVYGYLPFIRATGIVSVYEYLERRFNLATRLFGAAVFLLFQVGRIGIILYLPAIVLSTVTGIDVIVSIVVMGVLATLYTALGGIEAVVWTDVSQVVVLMGGAIISLGVVVWGVDGGLGEIVHTGLKDGKFTMVHWGWSLSSEVFWVVVVGNIFANLIPYTADQTVVQRYLTTSTTRGAARAVWMNAALTLPASIVFFGLGTALYVFYRHHPQLLDASVPADGIFPLFIMQQLPPGLAGLVLAGVFAASMSSLDSSLNSMATVVLTDYIGRFRRYAESSLLRGARVLTVAFGAVGTGSAILLATMDITSLLDAFREILGLFGGSLAGLFLLGITSRRANGPGALIGGGGSALIVGIVKTVTAVHFFLYAAVGIVSCVVLGWLASFAFPSAKKNIAGLTWRERIR